MTELRFAFSLDGRVLHFIAVKLLAVVLLLGLAWWRRGRVPRWDAIAGLAGLLLAFNVLLDLGRVGLSYNHPGWTGRSELAPLFAVLDPSFGWPILVNLVCAAGLLVFAVPRRTHSQLSAVGFATLLFAGAFLLPLTAAFSSPSDQVYQQFFRSGRDYLQHAPALSSMGAFLSGYVESMPGLSIHARTHGPGALLLLALLRDLTGGSEAGLALSLAAIGGLLPLLCWRLAVPLVGERCARLSGLLLLLSPAFQHFSFVSMEAVFAIAMLLALGSWLRALFAGEGSPGFACAAGVLFYAAACFSFSTAVVGGVAVLAGWLGVRRELVPFNRLLGSALLAVSGFMLCWLCVWAATGFELLSCLETAIALNAAEMGSAWRSAAHYGLVSSGNLVAFALGCGVPLAALALRAAPHVLRDRSLAGCVLLACVATLAIVTVAGLYQWEVERIWLFLVPFAAVAAAPELERSGFTRVGLLRALLALQWLQALLSEIAFDTYW